MSDPSVHDGHGDERAAGEVLSNLPRTRPQRPSSRRTHSAAAESPAGGSSPPASAPSKPAPTRARSGAKPAARASQARRPRHQARRPLGHEARRPLGHQAGLPDANHGNRTRHSRGDDPAGADLGRRPGAGASPAGLRGRCHGSARAPEPPPTCSTRPSAPPEASCRRASSSAAARCAALCRGCCAADRRRRGTIHRLSRAVAQLAITPRGRRRPPRPRCIYSPPNAEPPHCTQSEGGGPNAVLAQRRWGESAGYRP